jgi:hypothetical protein
MFLDRPFRYLEGPSTKSSLHDNDGNRTLLRRICMVQRKRQAKSYGEIPTSLVDFFLFSTIQIEIPIYPMLHILTLIASLLVQETVSVLLN